MALFDGKPVELFLLTRDDRLEEMLRSGLENEVRRIDEAAAGTGNIPDDEDTPQLILVDMRLPNTQARACLAAMNRRSITVAPLIILIADRDEETEGLGAYTRMIGGRISSDMPVEDLTRLVDNVLADNWAIEDLPEGS